MVAILWSLLERIFKVDGLLKFYKEFNGGGRAADGFLKGIHDGEKYEIISKIQSIPSSKDIDVVKLVAWIEVVREVDSKMLPGIQTGLHEMYMSFKIE